MSGSVTHFTEGYAVKMSFLKNGRDVLTGMSFGLFACLVSI